MAISVKISFFIYKKTLPGSLTNRLMRFHEIFRFREDLCPKKSCCIVIDYAIMVSAQSLTTGPRRICMFYLKKIKKIIMLTQWHNCLSAYVLLMQPLTKWMQYPHSQLYYEDTTMTMTEHFGSSHELRSSWVCCP